MPFYYYKIAELVQVINGIIQLHGMTTRMKVDISLVALMIS